jgi:hypothetical protein
VGGDAFWIDAPVFFQGITDKTLKDVRAFARCYIDDIIIFTRSHTELKLHLWEVFQRLREKGNKCHPKKLRCAIMHVSYLRAIINMVAPTDESELRALLGT